MKPSKPSDSAGAPRWETGVMALSFVGLWAWFAARQTALREGAALSVWWQVALGASLVLLLWIFVRRMKRTLAALKSVDPARRGRSGPN